MRYIPPQDHYELMLWCHMKSTKTLSSSTIVGRQSEQAELGHARDSGRPELIAVYGRRRIGKTFLVRRFFETELCFELTGMREAKASDQLQNFALALAKTTGYRHDAPRHWPEAFQWLIRALEGPKRRSRRQIVFLDELPWLASRRSGFLPAFEHFWNAWGSRQDHLIVVICGSAASWMIAKVIRDKGGLHNRVTRMLSLQPFRLQEIEEFLQSRSIALTRPQILELAMATGGVPYYLDYVRKGRSAAQCIDALFFAANSPLRDEFNNLYAALFEHHERHVKVIRVLARKASGLTRQEIAKALNWPSGGNLSTVLGELELSGFVGRVPAWGRVVREPVYRLIDELTLFHLRWVEGKRDGLDGQEQWLRVHGTPAWQAWSGYAFESLCLKHVPQIKQALGISGVQTTQSDWRYRARDKEDQGAQIDLLIDRRDGVINACEMKFSQTPFIIDKRYAVQLRTKLETFKLVTGTRKAIFLTFVTSDRLARNEYAAQLVQSEVTGDALFG